MIKNIFYRLPDYLPPQRKGDGFFIMINASELRIGNVIHVKDYQSKYSVITEIQRDALTVKGESGKETYCTYDEAEPIPLTEEILLQCGFERDKNGFHLEDLNSTSLSVTQRGEFLICFNDRVLHNELKAKEVHQLQNIHFAFTGEELPINIDTLKI